MTFNQPRNGPVFSTNRAEQDNYWGQNYADGAPGSSRQSYSYASLNPRSSTNGHAKKSSMSADQIKEKIGDMLGTTSANELPMYKDKPRFPSKQKGVFRILGRGRWKRWVAVITVLLVLWWFSSSAMAWLSVKEVQWATRRDMVKQVFLISWEDYAKNAWGKDVYRPISHKSNFLIDNESSGAGWIIVDALDTAMMMNCTKQVAQARKWIETSLDFGKLGGDGLNTFETTIRVLGGLLSAHYLSITFPNLAPQRDDDWGQKGEDLYIEKAVDLADRLLGAFDSPTGIPYTNINLNTSQGIASKEIDGASLTAEAGTVQLELKYVTKLTGEPLYWNIAEKVMQAIDTPRAQDGLVPKLINPNTGSFEGHVIRLGSRGDSYYEYLVKQYLQTGEKIYKDMWEESLEGIKRHMITWSKTADFTILAERPSGLTGEWNGKMDHLTCFLPGTIALGVTEGLTVAETKQKMGSSWGRKQEENLLLAEELMKTCWGMYVFTPTNLAAETSYLKMTDPPRKWNFDDDTWTQPRSKANFEDIKGSAYAKDASWRDDYEVREADAQNLQRPEVIESLFLLWRITGKEMYREWGWRVFKSFNEYSKVVNSFGQISGFTSLDSVKQIPPRHLDTLIVGSNVASQFAEMNTLKFKDDNMEGFWLSETLKYLYLLFSDDITDDWSDLSKVVVSTQAHFFPRFDASNFPTGWTRQPGSAPP